MKKALLALGLCLVMACTSVPFAVADGTDPVDTPSTEATPIQESPASPSSESPVEPMQEPSPTDESADPLIQAEVPESGLESVVEETPSRSRVLAVTGPGTLDDTRTGRFVQSLAYFAHQSQLTYGVPASVSLAQAILESGWGDSTLSRFGQSYFGIKCTSTMSMYQSGCVSMSTYEFINGGYSSTIAGFRTYSTVSDSFMDHGLLLKSLARYAPAFATSTPDNFARALQTGGYATDPDYANKLIALMDQYNLRAYDSFNGQILINVSGGIGTLYQSLGGVSSALGRPIGSEVQSAVSDVIIRNFDKGAIIWSDSNGGYALTGAMWDAYRGSKDLRTRLGKGISAVYSGCSGTVQDFAGGQIVITATQTITVTGAIGALYLSLGRQTSYLGCPTSTEGNRGDGFYQTFAQNYRIYWSATTGAVPVYTKGAIGGLYLSIGGATSYIGYPTATEDNHKDGLYQTFQNYRIYWSATTGAVPVYTKGAIGGAYLRMGGATSYIGYPTATEDNHKDGLYQTFQNYRIYWSATTGAVPVYTKGAIGGLYLSIGGATSYIGYPTATEDNHKDGLYQTFENYRIYWSATTGAVPVYTKGAIGGAYLRMGGATSYIGYPTATEDNHKDGLYQTFENCRFYWSAATGAWPVYTIGAIGGLYLSMGGPASRLGYPTGQEARIDGSYYQTFLKGRIYWSTNAGAWASVG